MLDELNCIKNLKGEKMEENNNPQNNSQESKQETQQEEINR